MRAETTKSDLGLDLGLDVESGLGLQILEQRDKIWNNCMKLLKNLKVFLS